MHVDMWDLKTGDIIVTRSALEAEVLAPTRDGEWVRVRYAQGEDRHAGTEDLCAAGEIRRVKEKAQVKEKT